MSNSYCLISPQHFSHGCVAGKLLKRQTLLTQEYYLETACCCETTNVTNCNVKFERLSAPVPQVIGYQNKERMLFAHIGGCYSVSTQHSRQFCSFGREPACKKKALVWCRAWQRQVGITRYPWGMVLVSVQRERLNEGIRSCFILLGVAAEAQEEDRRGRTTQINTSFAQ